MLNMRLHRTNCPRACLLDLAKVAPVAPAQSRCYIVPSPAERDLHFDADKTISAYADEARCRGHIVT
jgi:hypothetical protein